MPTKTFKFIVNVDIDLDIEEDMAFNSVCDAIEAVRFVADASGEVQN